MCEQFLSGGALVTEEIDATASIIPKPINTVPPLITIKPKTREDVHVISEQVQYLQTWKW